AVVTDPAAKRRLSSAAALSVFGNVSANFHSFSAVSKRNFASKYAFESIFQNLPDSQAESFEI
ncbi:MAG: hypothetical protein VX670_11240, partial [Candidatus Latescibacterota bacterium]|nr:hypothetical protein [Candidatus Latescibacterota bacterium]